MRKLERCPWWLERLLAAMRSVDASPEPDASLVAGIVHILFGFVCCLFAGCNYCLVEVFCCCCRSNLHIRLSNFCHSNWPLAPVAMPIPSPIFIFIRIAIPIPNPIAIKIPILEVVLLLMTVPSSWAVCWLGFARIYFHLCTGSCTRVESNCMKRFLLNFWDSFQAGISSVCLGPVSSSPLRQVSLDFFNCWNLLDLQLAVFDWPISQRHF